MSRVPTRRDVFVASLRVVIAPYQAEVNRIGHATLLRGLRRILLITTALRGTMATHRYIPLARQGRVSAGGREIDWTGIGELMAGGSVIVDNHHVHNVGSVPLSLSLGRR